MELSRVNIKLICFTINRTINRTKAKHKINNAKVGI